MIDIADKIIKSLEKLNTIFDNTLLTDTEIKKSKDVANNINANLKCFIATINSVKESPFDHSDIDDVTLTQLSNYLDVIIQELEKMYDLITVACKQHDKQSNYCRAAPVIKELKRIITMKLINLRDLTFFGKDVYTLETIGDYIIVNDHHQGIYLLDHALNIIKTIKLFDGVIIDRCYKEFSDKSLLLCCYENSCFIHFDIDTWEFNAIMIEQGDDIHFSHLYWWDNVDEVTLVTTDQEIFKLSLTTKTLIKITPEELQNTIPEFYTIWERYSHLFLRRFMPNEKVLLTEDTFRRKLIIYNYEKHTEEHIPCFLEETHDFLYRDGKKVFIHEEQLDICYETSTGGTLTIKDPYMFARARFLDDSRLVVLTYNQSGVREGTITIYQIQE